MRGASPPTRAQVQRERLNILDILNRFKSVKVSAAQLFELLPRLQVRYYSIASSDKIHPTTVAIVAVVDRDTMPSGKVTAALCCAVVSVCVAQLSARCCATLPAR